MWCEARSGGEQIAEVCDPYGVPVYSGGGFDSNVGISWDGLVGLAQGCTSPTVERDWSPS